MVTKQQHIIQPLAAQEPVIGLALAMIEDCRTRTYKALRDLDPAAVDWVGGFNDHSIGTLLYHIAAVEISWLGIEVTEEGLPDEAWALFPHEVRDDAERLTAVSGVSLDEHQQRLGSVRDLLLETYKTMSLDEYRRARAFEKYDVTPEWVLHHLMQHEAEHRDEMMSLRAAAEAALPPE